MMPGLALVIVPITCALNAMLNVLLVADWRFQDSRL